MKFLDSLSYPILGVLAVMLALAPWPAGPEPHLVEKIRMLFAGQLSRPIDIFDLVMHASGLVLLLAKAVRDLLAR